MISNRDKREWSKTVAMRVKYDGQWHYLAVKKLQALLRGITSKHHNDFYYLN